MQTVCYYELLYHLNVADWEAALETARTIQEFLSQEQEGVALGRRMAFWYNLAILYFLTEDFSASLHWVNTIIQASGAAIREDIQHFARILVVLIHYELGNWEILEYLHRSSYRYLFDRKQLFPYEKRLMDGLKQLTQHPDPQLQSSILRDLRADLGKMMAESPQGPGIQELFCWLDSKLSGRSLREVMAETLVPQKS